MMELESPIFLKRDGNDYSFYEKSLLLQWQWRDLFLIRKGEKFLFPFYVVPNNVSVGYYSQNYLNVLNLCNCNPHPLQFNFEYFFKEVHDFDKNILKMDDMNDLFVIPQTSQKQSGAFASTFVVNMKKYSGNESYLNDFCDEIVKGCDAILKFIPIMSPKEYKYYNMLCTFDDLIQGYKNYPDSEEKTKRVNTVVNSIEKSDLFTLTPIIYRILNTSMVMDDDVFIFLNNLINENNTILQFGYEYNNMFAYIGNMNDLNSIENQTSDTKNNIIFFVTIVKNGEEIVKTFPYNDLNMLYIKKYYLALSEKGFPLPKDVIFKIGSDIITESMRKTLDSIKEKKNLNIYSNVVINFYKMMKRYEEYKKKKSIWSDEYSDLINSWAIGELSTRGLSPFFVQFYFSFKMIDENRKKTSNVNKENTPIIKFDYGYPLCVDVYYLAMVIEKMDYTLYQIMMERGEVYNTMFKVNGKFSIDKFRNVIMQFVFGFISLEYYLRGIHRDAHNKNIMVKKVDKETRLIYKVDIIDLVYAHLNKFIKLDNLLITVIYNRFNNLLKQYVMNTLLNDFKEFTNIYNFLVTKGYQMNDILKILLYILYDNYNEKKMDNINDYITIFDSELINNFMKNMNEFYSTNQIYGPHFNHIISQVIENNDKNINWLSNIFADSIIILFNPNRGIDFKNADDFFLYSLKTIDKIYDENGKNLFNDLKNNRFIYYISNTNGYIVKLIDYGKSSVHLVSEMSKQNLNPQSSKFNPDANDIQVNDNYYILDLLNEDSDIINYFNRIEGGEIVDRIQFNYGLDLITALSFLLEILLSNDFKMEQIDKNSEDYKYMQDFLKILYECEKNKSFNIDKKFINRYLDENIIKNALKESNDIINIRNIFEKNCEKFKNDPYQRFESCMLGSMDYLKKKTNESICSNIITKPQYFLPLFEKNIDWNFDPSKTNEPIYEIYFNFPPTPHNSSLYRL